MPLPSALLSAAPAARPRQSPQPIQPRLPFAPLPAARLPAARLGASHFTPGLRLLRRLTQGLAGTAALLCLLAAPASAMGCNLPGAAAAFRAEVLAGVNAERARAGLPALRLERSLERAAQGHACDSAGHDRMSHVSSDGSTLRDRVKRQGYRLRTAAENVGYGFKSGSSAVGWWMTSPGHRHNILMANVTEAGIGIAVTPGSSRIHWVLVLGASR